MNIKLLNVKADLENVDVSLTLRLVNRNIVLQTAFKSPTTNIETELEEGKRKSEKN